MDLADKVDILGRAARYDLCCSSLGNEEQRRASAARDPLRRWIYPAVISGGRRVALFKVLMTDACGNDCAYCANRCSRSSRRTRFEPEELVRAFLDLHRKGIAEGLFLSSGIPDTPSATMDRMLQAVEILRVRDAFPGYIHLKILPGARFDQVERAVQLADRVSINLEAPNPGRLRRISPDKAFDELMRRMQWVQTILSRGEDMLSAGHTTQFVVGAADEADREILDTTARLYARLGLRRAHFSAFQPVKGTTLEDHPPTSPVREHRLYQADWLLRQYGFQVEELIFDEAGHLPEQMDPKEAWARAHPECFPVEVNRADYPDLLRVPGIGPRSARRIVEERAKGKFHTWEALRVAKRAKPYVLIDGKSPGHEQMNLWEGVNPSKSV